MTVADPSTPPDSLPGASPPGSRVSNSPAGRAGWWLGIGLLVLAAATWWAATSDVDPSVDGGGSSAKSVAGELDSEAARQAYLESLTERYQHGIAALYRHEMAKAEAEFLAVVDAMPQPFQPQIALGISQLNQANPEDVARAMQTFEKILERNDELPRAHFCLGDIHDYLGNPELALDEFQRALALAPSNADAHCKVGQLLFASGKRERALPHLEAAARANPDLSAAWYQLARLYRALARVEDATRAQARFEALRDSKRGHPRGYKFTEFGSLAEPDLHWHARDAVRDPASVVRFAAPLPIAGGKAPFAFVDVESTGDLVLWTAGGTFALGDTLVAQTAVPELANAFSFAVGDFSEDGRLDLVVGETERVIAYRGTDTGYEAVQTFDGFYEPAVRLIDVDLEGDLDLFITDAQGAPRLAVNGDRDGKPFWPIDDSPLCKLNERQALYLARDFDRDGDCEFYFANQDSGQFVENDPQWRFTIAPEARAFPLDTPVHALAASDLDGDGAEDLVVAARWHRGMWWNDGAGGFTHEPAHESFLMDVGALAIADVDLDGRADLIVGNARETRVLINLGHRRFEYATQSLPPALGIATGDVDGDFDPDIVLSSPSGELVYVRNLTAEQPGFSAHAAKIYLGGKREAGDRRSNLLGIGARVEILGATGQAQTHFGGTSRTTIGQLAQGMQPLTIGLGTRTDAQILIHWTDRVMQAEALHAGQLQRYEEVQRKSSSCPVLFTWNGREYEFITDFMGGGGLGFWMGIDDYAPPDPTEVVRLAPGCLQAIDGHYRMSVMEPMQEVAYIDALALIAIDHAANTLVYPDERFAAAGPPATGQPLVVERAEREFPVAAIGANGRDCREQLLRVDRQYAGPERLDPALVGYAAPSSLTLTVAQPVAGERPTLFLNGWVEYPYSRVNFAASHDRRRLVPPTVSFRRADGDAWQTFACEVGYPAGMPKTMVIDLSAARGARHFRISTNMEIYWDQIFIADARARDIVRHDVPLSRAVLRFGGYPREYSDDGRLPATYHYGERDPYLPYRRVPGALTDYGEVGELVAAGDDRFAIIGGGDELWLEFSAELPPLADGMERTFLLETVGYCKDIDPLTAERSSVEPLPYSAMPNYPPPATGAPDRSTYRARWNHRVR